MNLLVVLSYVADHIMSREQNCTLMTLAILQISILASLWVLLSGKTELLEVI